MAQSSTAQASWEPIPAPPDATRLSQKEAIWLACREKACCQSGFVIPTGRDVWRIARALDAPPWSFLLYFQAPSPRRDAFALDRSDRRFRIALAKGPTRRTKTPPPCIFLLRTRTGHHRCGLGALRPLVCRAFPAEIQAGVLALRPDSGCTCRTWALADVDITAERALVEARQADAEAYCTVVAQWNDRVANTTGDTPYSFYDFCTYLLSAYDQAAGGSEL